LHCVECRTWSEEEGKYKPYEGPWFPSIRRTSNSFNTEYELSDFDDSLEIGSICGANTAVTNALVDQIDKRVATHWKTLRNNVNSRIKYNKDKINELTEKKMAVYRAALRCLDVSIKRIDQLINLEHERANNPLRGNSVDRPPGKESFNIPQSVGYQEEG
jgi:hypothetical protein